MPPLQSHPPKTQGRARIAHRSVLRSDAGRETFASSPRSAPFRTQGAKKPHLRNDLRRWGRLSLPERARHERFPVVSLKMSVTPGALLQSESENWDDEEVGSSGSASRLSGDSCQPRDTGLTDRFRPTRRSPWVRAGWPGQLTCHGGGATRGRGGRGWPGPNGLDRAAMRGTWVRPPVFCRGCATRPHTRSGGRARALTPSAVRAPEFFREGLDYLSQRFMMFAHVRFRGGDSRRAI
jgi:hypothetical protein